MKDKVSDCDYPHMWGALALNHEIIMQLDRFKAHPGLDLEYLVVDNFNKHFAFEVDGRYFDVGTLAGYRNLLNRLEL